MMQCDPKVGYVYRKDGGPKGYMVVVSNNGSTHAYVNTDAEGRVIGSVYAISYYYRRRALVGKVVEAKWTDEGLQIWWERLHKG
jgi:hypothetical protein